jgi:signal transduction histidine kinase/DNA-binding response OmpR family regulator
MNETTLFMERSLVLMILLILAPTGSAIVANSRAAMRQEALNPDIRHPFFTRLVRYAATALFFLTVWGAVGLVGEQTFQQQKFFWKQEFAGQSDSRLNPTDIDRAEISVVRIKMAPFVLLTKDGAQQLLPATQVEQARAIGIGLSSILLLLLILLATRAHSVEINNRRLRTLLEDKRQTEAALQTARDLAEKANTAKSQFLASMSHEIRTPINGILGMNAILLDTSLTSDQRHCAEVVSQSARSLLQIINDILDYSKIEAGRVELDLTEFDLYSNLELVLELLATEATHKGLNFSLVTMPDVPEWVLGDAGRIRQILLNLCGNAVKFTQSGEICVRVSTVEERQDGLSVLLFEVQDTGIGIAHDSQRELFRMFSQVRDKTTNPSQGTGLGLAISKRLVELMSGDMGVDSFPGEGSRFWFSIPLPRCATREGKIQPVLTGQRVLLVENNANQRTMIARLIARCGGVPLVASSTVDALDLVEDEEQIDIAIIEQELDEKDAETLATMIKLRRHPSPLPTVLLTRRNLVPDLAKLSASGFTDFLSKPPTHGRLDECFRKVLRQPRAHTTRTCALEQVRPTSHTDRQLRILVAEDNRVNQELTLHFIEKIGLEGVAVFDGKQAVEAWQRGGFELIIMDIQMPGMDGVEATRLIREMECGSNLHTPIIAMTAHAMRGDREKYLACGMDDYLAKPVEYEDLVSCLERNLNFRRGRIEPRESKSALRIVDKESCRILDRESALDRIGGSNETLNRLTAIFLADAPVCIRNIREAIERRENNVAEEWAHSLKGAAAAVGAELLNRSLQKLRQELKQDHSTTLPTIFSELEQEYLRAEREMRQVLEEGGATS